MGWAKQNEDKNNINTGRLFFTIDTPVLTVSIILLSFIFRKMMISFLMTVSF